MAEMKINSEQIVSESISLSSLTIEKGGSIKAPEGKYVTLTVDGVGIAPVPGAYAGDIALTVRDEFVKESLRFGEKTVTHFRSGVVVEDGKRVAESSVDTIVQGGSVTDEGAKDVRIESHEWNFNGFYITGDTEYTIDGADIELHGDGTDDFVGYGAGVAAAGNAKVTINNSTIRTYGVTRGAVFSGGNSVVTANDCKISTESYVPTPEEIEEGMKTMRMMEPPWSIGIRGHGRTTNIGQHGTFNLNRCHVTSNSWGVLSVDGATVNRMNVKDSLIELIGESGYGLFTICDDIMFDYKEFGDYGCYDVIDNSTVNVPDYALIMSLGNSSGEFKNGSIVNSKRFGVIAFRNSGGILRVNSKAVMNTGEAIVQVKGANTYIEFDDAILKPENGVILSLIDNDDIGLMGGKQPYPIPLGEVDVRDKDRDLTTAIPTEDVFLKISNMETAGHIFNATTDLKVNVRVKPIPMPGMEPPAPDAPPPDFGSLRGFVGDDLQGAKNLDVKLVNARLNGIISASTAAYKEGLTEIGPDICEELGMVTHTPAQPINNGVILTVDKDSVWTVPETCFLTSLTWEDGGKIVAADGKDLTVLVNGDVVTEPGTYTGRIVIEVD
jgi:hypothetical protein